MLDKKRNNVLDREVNHNSAEELGFRGTGFQGLSFKDLSLFIVTECECPVHERPFV